MKMFSCILGKVLSASHLRLYSTTPKSKWNLVSAVCLQRKPIVTKEFTDLEKRVKNLLFQTEEENSWKSDWELQIEKDQEILAKIKEGDTSQVGSKLCKDWEDEWKAELDNLRLEPCLTEADKKKDVKSIHRLLSSTLILVVKQEESKNHWILPFGVRSEGETMRQSAERVLFEGCGADLKVQFYGNAPCGFYKYKFPKEDREKSGVEGNKVFFFKAYLTGGEIKCGSTLKDYKWIGRNELNSVLPPKYSRSVDMFLFDEK